jgi:hypothetical protein
MQANACVSRLIRFRPSTLIPYPFSLRSSKNFNSKNEQERIHVNSQLTSLRAHGIIRLAFDAPHKAKNR